MLDGNIFDKLRDDHATRDLLQALQAAGSVRVVISRTVRDELQGAPVPDLAGVIDLAVVGNATPIAGLMCAGDSLGDVDAYLIHLGEAGASKVPDALIAAAAQFHADWLVSEDDRMIRRSRVHLESITALYYADFAEKLLHL